MVVRVPPGLQEAEVVRVKGTILCPSLPIPYSRFVAWLAVVAALAETGYTGTAATAFVIATFFH